jgi:hypothetical protein
MPTVITQTEYLTFAAVGSLHAVPTGTPAWRAIDLSELYGMGPRVGENRQIPGVTGRLAVPREIDELRVSLRLRFFGGKDREGLTHSDPFQGVITNLLYFRKHVLDYVPSRSVTFTRRTGGTSTGSVIVEGWESAPDPSSAGDVHLMVVRLTVAAGSLVTP